MRPAIFFLICATPLACSKKYDLRAHALAEGSLVESEVTLSVTGAKITLSGPATAMSLTADLVQDTKAEIRVAGVQPRAITSAELKFRESVLTTRVNLPGGEVREETEHLPLSGQTIHLAGNGGQWEAKLPSGEPTEKQARALSEMGHPLGWNMYPPGELELGKTYPLPADAWPSSSTSGTITLAELVEQDGEKLARLQFDMTADQTGERHIKLKLKGEILHALAKGIPVSLDGTGTLQSTEPMIAPTGENVGTQKVQGPCTLKVIQRLMY